MTVIKSTLAVLVTTLSTNSLADTMNDNDKQEGIESISKKNKIKSDFIYNEIDRNKCFSGFSEVSDRSIMNATFNINEGFDVDLFNKICSNNNISGINGHRSVGGYRASIYNALPLESLNILIDAMKEFELSQE